MSGRHPLPGGDLELSLLAALWELRGHEPTVRHLYEAVGRPRGIVYTTVAKVLDRMVGKGLVTRTRAGRTYVYRPLVGRGETHRTMVRDTLARIMGRDPRPAVAALLGALEDISPELLDKLAAELAVRSDPAAKREECDGT